MNRDGFSKSSWTMKILVSSTEEKRKKGQQACQGSRILIDDSGYEGAQEEV